MINKCKLMYFLLQLQLYIFHARMVTSFLFVFVVFFVLFVFSVFLVIFLYPIRQILLDFPKRKKALSQNPLGKSQNDLAERLREENKKQDKKEKKETKKEQEAREQSSKDLIPPIWFTFGEHSKFWELHQKWIKKVVIPFAF